MAENNLNRVADGELDSLSEASSAIGLQISMMENSFKTEMTKLATMVKDTVGSLQCTIISLREQFEKRLAEVEQRFDGQISVQGVSTTQNGARNISGCNRLHQKRLNSEDATQSTNSYRSRGDNPSSLTTPSDQMNLANVQDHVPQCKGGNTSGNGAKTSQSCPNLVMDKSIEVISQSKGSNHHPKIKPQNFDGETDFDEFLCQFEITCEINTWNYKEKSLYLANCLTGKARCLLNGLDHDGRRDYDTLVVKLRNRFGSVNQSEIYRSQLKSRTRNRAETIQELAQAIKKLVRQAYPGVNKEVVETLSLDNFIDALTDNDMRMRVRELNPKSLEEAEQACVRLEAYKIADKQQSRSVCRIISEAELSKEDQNYSSSQFELLSEAISSLTDEVKQLGQRNVKNSNAGSCNYQRFQRNHLNYNRYNNRNQRYHRIATNGYRNHRYHWNRKNDYGNQRYDNGKPRFHNQNQRFRKTYRNDWYSSAANGAQNYGYQYKGSNSDETMQKGNFLQNSHYTGSRGLQDATHSSSNDSGEFESKSSRHSNWSGWRATTQQH